jgi:hypothetical protein
VSPATAAPKGLRDQSRLTFTNPGPWRRGRAATPRSAPALRRGRRLLRGDRRRSASRVVHAGCRARAYGWPSRADRPVHKAQYRLGMYRSAPRRLLIHHYFPIDTGLSSSQAVPRPERSQPAPQTCFAYPHSIPNLMCHTPSASSVRTPACLTAGLTRFAFSGCDDEHPQAQRRVGVRLFDSASCRVGCHRKGSSRAGLLLHRTGRDSGDVDRIWPGRPRRPRR